MGHEPGVELPGLAGGKTKQQVELALGEGLRTVDALIRDHKVRLIGGSPGEGALRGEAIEEGLHLYARTLPGCRSVVLEQHPARALLDARSHEQGQPPRGQIAPVSRSAAAEGEGAGA